MIYFSLTLRLISQFGVVYYLHTKSSETKGSIVLIAIHSLGIYSVWRAQILTGFPEIWLLLGFVVYQWLFAVLLLYVNKKIKEQQL